jgi:hypothetical protein
MDTTTTLTGEESHPCEFHDGYVTASLVIVQFDVNDPKKDHHAKLPDLALTRSCLARSSTGRRAR